MKREKGFVCALLCMSVFLLSGCKTQSYDLNQGEQEKIADYAAHVVTKYNERQEEGYLKVSREEIEQTEEKSQKTSEDKKEKEEKPKSEKKEEGSGEKTKEETVSLSQALKLENGLKASFAGYDVTNSYMEEDYFSLNAMAGKTYLVLHINLESEGQKIDCDMLSKNLNFRIVINGDKQVSAQTSILLNDLGIYQGTIAENAVQECVLLFETEAEALESIESLQLKVSDGASFGTVNLQ